MSLTCQISGRTRDKAVAILADHVINPRLKKAHTGKRSRILLTEYCRLESISQSESDCGRSRPTPDLLWKWPAEALTLHRGEVHLWRACLDQHITDLCPFNAVLSEDESERAAHYRFEKDRRQFILRRALLRMILSRYLATEPERLKFTYGPYGKPALAGPHGDNLRFNLSHSDGLALFAVAQDSAIGVDVERVRVIPEAEQIGARYFSPLEMAAWPSLPHGQRTEAFLRLWSRKEASLKLCGRGLFDLTERIPSGHETKALDDGSVWPRFSAPLTECVLYELTPATGHVGALALAVPEGVRSQIT